MDAKERSTRFLQKQLSNLQDRVANLFPMMRGSVVHIGTKSKRPTYSLNMKGKTRIVYLGETKECIAQAWIENHKKLLKIVDEMTLINIELIRRMEPHPPKKWKIS